jgi:hypothetical protein
MSFLTSLITGYLNADAEIMKDSREYEAEQAEKKRLAKIESDKATLAWERGVIKQALAKQDDLYKTYLTKYAEGKVKEFPNALKLIELNKRNILMGKGPLFDFGNYLKPKDDAEKFATIFGSGANKIGTNIDIDKNPTYNNSEALLGFFNTIGLDETQLNKVKNFSSSEKAFMLGKLNSAKNKYSNEFFGQTTKGGWNPAQSPKQLPILENQFKGGGLKTLQIALGDTSGTGVNTNNKLVQDHELSQQNENRTNSDTYFFFPNNTNTTVTPTGITVDENLKGGLEKVAKKLVPDGNIKTAGIYFRNVNDIKFMMGGKLQNEDVKNLFIGSVKLASFEGANGLDPDKRLYKYSDDEIKFWYSKVYDGVIVKPGDLDLAAAVLMPSMSYPNEGVTEEFASERSSLTFQNYAVNSFKGKIPADKPLEIAKAFTEMKQRASDLKLAEDQIIDIIRLKDEVNETEAFSKLRNFAIGTLSPSQGFVGDLIGNLFGSADNRRLKTDGTLYDNGKRSLTQDFLDRLESRVTNAKSEQQAQLEAIRISVAFRMARAADPSGRLSNQDIELQLMRLGGSPFDTPKMALAKLKTVLDDIKRGQKVLNVLVRYGSSTEQMTKNDQRYFDAIITANELTNRKNAIDTPSSSLNNNDSTLTFKKPKSGIYQDNIYISGTDYYIVPNHMNNDFTKFTKIPSNRLNEYKK